jgi:structural maintenance of chromosomes protein 6
LAHHQRRKRYFHFRTEIVIRAKIIFVDLLSRRAYGGSLTFDHRKEEIRVKVKPAGESNHGAAKDTKSLSGGEKSFAQICLLLAVWEAMGSPIRALDELFDVSCCFADR